MSTEYFASGSYPVKVNVYKGGKAKNDQAENEKPVGETIASENTDGEKSEEAKQGEKLQISIPATLRLNLICQVPASPDKYGVARYRDSVYQTFMAPGCIGIYPRDLLDKEFQDRRNEYRAVMASLRSRESEARIRLTELKVQISLLGEAAGDLENEMIACQAKLTAYTEETKFLKGKLKKLEEGMNDVKDATVEPSGRMMLDPELLKRTGIGPGAAHVLGQGNHLEIWSEDAYKAAFLAEDGNRLGIKELLD